MNANYVSISFTIAVGLLFTIGAFGQFPKTFSSAELYHQLEKLSTTPAILYLAAHPDDENTRLISYFENELNVRTAYLSLTRGDGGQNLIGTEIGPATGVLRTQELLAARRIDGGEQFFTRAVDFGYSKSAEESFEKWGKENILADVVWVIRKFRPDVIVTRFPPSRSAGHGHHEASAILAEEAFDLAADPNAFPEQLRFVETWQPKSLYFNASTWWIKDLADRATGSKDYVTIDVGEYNQLLGESYAQIAAMSRSQHRSQGFGSDFPYGTQVEYLEYVKGEKADPQEGILAEMTQGWDITTVPKVGEIFNNALKEFDFKNPQNSAASIVEAAKLMQAASSNPFLKRKITETNDLLLELLGISIELNTDIKYATRQSDITSRLDIVNPSLTPITLHKAQLGSKTYPFEKKLENNELFSEEVIMQVPSGTAYSNPYWLKEPYENLFEVSDYALLGNAENEPAIQLALDFEIDGYAFQKMAALRNKTVDPAKAVIFTPVYVVPSISFNFSENVVIGAGAPQSVYLKIENYGKDFTGQVSLKLPAGWQSDPSSQEIEMSASGESTRLEFQISANETAVRGEAEVEVLSAADLPLDGSAMSLQEIRYEHINAQIILRPASITLIPIDLKKGNVKLIGYIDGPGDDVAKYLNAAGYTVEHLSTDEVMDGNLSRYDAIVTGIRAFNTNEDLFFANKNLNSYVENGGTWIVQYNTSRGLKSENIGPYPFEITRERVTDEMAVAKFLKPNHQVMNYPNKISDEDFNGWVQERGLYFAADVDEKFEAIISWNDPEEPAREGGLIIAPYGNGHFIYTGISFFRELPAGVPGAYRLLANILALGDKKTTGGND